MSTIVARLPKEDKPRFRFKVYIKVHVIPESDAESITEKGDVIYVSIREKAEQGAANRQMLEILRSRFGARRRVRIVSGHHSPHKIISVD